MLKSFFSIDNLLIVGMSALAFFSLQKIYSLEYAARPVVEREVVAFISHFQNNVKRRTFDSLSWVGLNSYHELFNGDQIFTHPYSSVRVDFIDGQVLEIQEKSLVRIYQDLSHQQMQIDVSHGSFVFNISPDENVQTIFLSFLGEVYQISSQDQAQIQVSSDGQNASIEAVTGNVKLQSESVSVDLDQSRRVDVSSGSDVRDVKFLYQLIHPQNAIQMYFTARNSITFQWQEIVEQLVTDLNLVVADDPHFHNILIQQPVTEDSFELKKEALGEGLFYWALKQNQNIVSARRQFSIVKIPAAEWIYPNSLETSLYAEELPYHLNFKWGHELSDHQYLLRIEKLVHDQFSIYKQVKSYQDSLAVDFKEYGDYRVSILDLDSSSSLAPFRYLRIRSLELETPQILYPENETDYINYEDLLKLEMKASSVAGARFYRFHITPPDLEQFYIDVPFPVLEVSLEDSGQYSVSVEAHTKSGKRSEFSDSISFTYQRELYNHHFPEQGAMIELDRPDREVDFSWAHDPSLPDQQVYRIELSQNSSFSEILKSKEVQESHCQLVIGQQGVYYWRVYSISEDGKESFSRPFKVEIRPSPKLLPAPLLEQGEGVRIEFLDTRSETKSILEAFGRWSKNKFSFLFASAHAQEVSRQRKIRISWPQAPFDIQSYHLEVYQDLEQKELIFSDQSLEKPEVLLSLKVGNVYYWRVAYVDHWGRSGEFSDLIELSIPDDEMEMKNVESLPNITIQLDGPPHRTKLKEFQNVEFRWKLDGIGPDGVQGREASIDFSANLNFSDKVFSRPLSLEEFFDGKKKISFSDRLHDEEFFWRVRFVTDDGHEYRSLRRRFELPHKVEKIKINQQKEKKDESYEKVPERSVLKSFLRFAKVTDKSLYTNNNFDDLTLSGNSYFAGGIDYKSSGRSAFSADFISAKSLNDKDYRVQRFFLGHQTFKTKNFYWLNELTVMRYSIYEMNQQSVSSPDDFSEKSVLDFGIASSFSMHHFFSDQLSLSFSPKLIFHGSFSYQASCRFFYNRFFAGLYFAHHNKSHHQQFESASSRQLGVDLGLLFHF